MGTTSGFPTTAQQIDAEWLTRALRERGSLDGKTRVASFRLESLPEPGQTADLCRIRVEYDGEAEGAPRSLVAKFPASFGPARELARQYQSYSNEVLFYRLIAPSRQLPIPTAYAAELDPTSGDFVLLLEDLSAARIGSFFTSSVEDARTALTELARLHAAFWNDPLLDQHEFIRKPDDAPWYAMLKSVASQLPLAARAQFGDQFSPASLAAMERWIAVWDDLFGYSPDGLTLVHVDAHPKQMFFPTPELPRFALFDWQQPAKGPSANDVSRLLVTSLSVEARREHERALVDGYHEALVRFGVSDLTKERLWLLIRVAHVWNFYINVIAALQTDVNILAAMAATEGQDWRVVLLGRVDAAIADWDVGAALEALAAEARRARSKS